MNVEKVKEELADIVNYAILIADKYDLDIKQIVMDKLKEKWREISCRQSVWECKEI